MRNAAAMVAMSHLRERWGAGLGGTGAMAAGGGDFSPAVIVGDGGD